MSYVQLLYDINNTSFVKDKLKLLNNYDHPNYTIDEILNIINSFGNDYHYFGDHASIKYLVLEKLYNYFKEIDFNNFLILLNHILDSSRPRTLDLLIPKLKNLSFTFENFAYLLKINNIDNKTKFIRKALFYNIIKFNSFEDINSIYDIMKNKCHYKMSAKDLLLLTKIIDTNLNFIIINNKKFYKNDFTKGDSFIIKTKDFFVEIIKENDDIFKIIFSNKNGQSHYYDSFYNKKIIITSEDISFLDNVENNYMGEIINNLFIKN